MNTEIMATVAAGLRQHLLGFHATERHSRDAIERAYRLLAAPDSELVLCVNSHERLVKACEQAIAQIDELICADNPANCDENACATLQQLRAALAAVQPTPDHAPE